MKIKKANVKRLASLSALGAGALGFTAAPADASSIVYSGILNEQVDFGKHQTSIGFAGPNGVGARLSLFATSLPDSHGTRHSVRISPRYGSKGTRFGFVAGVHQRSGGDAVGFSASAKWSNAARGRQTVSEGPVAIRFGNSGTVSSFTAFGAKNRYLLFEFTGGDLPETLYGWAQLDVAFSHKHYPNVTLVDWAYDTSGSQIPAGDTGTPEPSTFALTGLAALALGAKGTRAWRAARKSASAAS